MYTKESLEQLRHRIDLTEVLSAHIDLKRAGSSYKALCPFHDEKTPSFVVQKGDGHYHCFGCGAHGDAIQFLMTYLNLSFVEAVEALAEQFHIFLEKTDKNEEKGVNKNVLKEALEYASLIYHYTLLHTEEGRDALNYLLKRGITIDFIHRFEIGYSTKSLPVIQKVLNEKKISNEDLIECGLVNSKTKRDFFQERITFPIRNPSGSIIGFSARKFRDETFGGKYINTPETPLFKKSRILFGLNYCRRRIVKEKRAILVEGQIDCLKMIEAGFNFTVAALGTAFGEGHVRELQNLGIREVYFLFDPDDAGQQAASKTGDLFQKIGIEVKVAVLPKGYDPDTYLSKHSPEKLIKELEKSLDYLSFQIGFLSRTLNPNSPAGKTELIERVTKQVKGWEQPVMIHESLKKIASITNVPEEIVGVREAYASQVYVKRQSNASFQSVDPNRILEQDFLRWLIIGQENKEFFEITKKHLTEEDFWTPICRSLFKSLLKEEETGNRIDLLGLMIDMEKEDAVQAIDEILKKKVNAERAETHFSETLQKLLDRQWLQKKEEIKMQIHSGKYSEDEVLELVRQFDSLNKTRPKVLNGK